MSMFPPGTLLQNRYRIIRSFDYGGMSQLFEVDDNGTRKLLKVLLNGHPKAITGFQKEAQVLSTFDHPGIVKVDTDGYFCCKRRGESLDKEAIPVHCLVMEKVPGINLEEWLFDQEPSQIDEKQAIAWLKQLLTILEFLHRQNYVHRDIKPSNIMLRPDGRLVLIDFGSVREIAQSFLAEGGEPEKGTSIGTLGYAPPEQMMGRAEKRSDFYALGCTIVYLLTGQDPGDLPCAGDRLLWHDHAAHLSESLTQLIDWLMQPAAEQRPRTIRVIRQALAQIEAEQARFPRWRDLSKTLIWSTVIAAFWLGVRSLGLLQPAELWTYDLFIRLRPLEEPDDRITIITIDDEDIAWQDDQGMERPPSQSLSDEALWELLSRLENLQPRVIGLDIIRDFPVSTNYPKLAEYLKTSDRIIGTCKVSDSTSGNVGIRPPPELSRDYIGFSDTVIDPDGIARRHLLYMPEIERSPCRSDYAFNSIVALEYLDAAGEFTASFNWKIQDTVFESLNSQSFGYQTIQTQGGQILLNYRSLNSLRDIAPSISLREFLRLGSGSDQLKAVEERIVLIGVTAESSTDWHKTPFAREDSRVIPGVFLQAHRTSQIISAVLDDRPLIRVWPLTHQIILSIGWSFLGGAIILSPRRRQHRIIVALVLSCCLLGISYQMVLQGVWLPIAIPIIILATLFISAEFQSIMRNRYRLKFPKT